MDEALPPWSRGRLIFSRARKGLRLLYECGLPALLYIARKRNLVRTLGLPTPGYLLSGLSPYEYWIKKNEPTPRDLARLKSEARRSTEGPRFIILLGLTTGDSAVAVENSVASILGQTWERWELRVHRSAETAPQVTEFLENLARDPRIHIPEASGSATAFRDLNEALRDSDGDFVAMLYAGDVLAPFALSAASETLWVQPDADLLYSDEDRISGDGKRRFNPHFKPDWSPDLLRSFNYIAGLTVFRKSVLEAAGGFRDGYEGERHYDLILRVVEKARRVSHIQKILYHRGAPYRSDPVREDGQSPGQRALTEHMRRLGVAANVFSVGEGRYRVRYRVEKNPEVSIIIPTKDKAAVLKTCVDSIVKFTAYPNYRIFVVEQPKPGDGDVPVLRGAEASSSSAPAVF